MVARKDRMSVNKARMDENKARMDEVSCRWKTAPAVRFRAAIRGRMGL